MPDILLIEPCDFQRYPLGGQLSFAKQMMKAFGNRLALVGLCTDNTPVGTWTEKEFGGVTLKYFAIGYWKGLEKKTFVPARFTAYRQFYRYRKAIFSLGVHNAFIQAPEALMAISNLSWDSLCYYFPGTRNPLHTTPRVWARLLAGPFDKVFFRVLQRADLILAAASKEEIDLLYQQSGDKLTGRDVIMFPTRVDTSLFKPLPKKDVRRELGIRSKGPIVVTSGRIHQEKGWDLLLSAFSVFAQKSRDAHMYFIGDGWDRNALESLISEYGISHQVSITGFVAPEQVARYLAAADLYVVGSYMEGWSLAMLEALACAKPIVSTDVSGARDMIVEGVNGFIVKGRDPKRFAEAMVRALSLKEREQTSLRIAGKYAVANLARDLSILWPPLRG